MFSNGRSFILHNHYTTSYRDRTKILDLQGFSRHCLQSSLKSEFHWSMIPLKTAFIFMQLPSAFPVADTAMAWICNVSPNDTSWGFSENSSRWGLDGEGDTGSVCKWWQLVPRPFTCHSVYVLVITRWATSALHSTFFLLPSNPSGSLLTFSKWRHFLFHLEGSGP